MKIEEQFSCLPPLYHLLFDFSFFKSFSKNGLTALMVAVQNGNYRTVEALLDLGADIYAVDKVRHTVQYSAVQYSTVQYSTVQCSTVQYSTVQYSTVQYSTVQYSRLFYYLRMSDSMTGIRVILTH